MFIQIGFRNCIFFDHATEFTGGYDALSLFIAVFCIREVYHQDLANQLFSAYAKVGEARNLASVIGEDELSPIDKKYLEFGKAFEERYIGQGPNENRTIEETLDLGWELLRILPKEELDRVDTKILDVYYKG